MRIRIYRGPVSSIDCRFRILSMWYPLTKAAPCAYGLINTGENPITKTKKRRPGLNSKGRATEEPELAGKLTRIQLKLLGDPLICVSLPTIVGYTPLVSCSLHGTRVAM